MPAFLYTIWTQNVKWNSSKKLAYTTSSDKHQAYIQETGIYALSSWFKDDDSL